MVWQALQYMPVMNAVNNLSISPIEQHEYKVNQHEYITLTG